MDIVRRLPWTAPYTGRAIRNEFSARWHGREEELRRALPLEASRYAAATSSGDLNPAVVRGGEGLDLVGEVEPAARTRSTSGFPTLFLPAVRRP
jgi:nitronate monooxygenase